MNKKITISLLLPLLFLIGCSDDEGLSQTENKDLNDVLLEIQEKKEQELKTICTQEMIPAKYASDCYFRELKACESWSGELIPKEELEKCMPVFLKEKIEDKIENMEIENIEEETGEYTFYDL